MNNIQEALHLLNEMADGITNIKNDLRESQNQRLQNLEQIFLFYPNSTINHWCNELFACCHKTSKWSKTNKWLSEEKLFQFLVAPWEDSFYETIDSDIEAIGIKENTHILVLTKEEKTKLHDFLVNYHLWLAKSFSNKGSISCDEVKQKIKELLEGEV